MIYYTAFLTEDFPPQYGENYITVFDLKHVYIDIETCVTQFVEEYYRRVLLLDPDNQLKTDIDRIINTFEDVKTFIEMHNPKNKLFSLRVKKINATKIDVYK